eukprot:403367812
MIMGAGNNDMSRNSIDIIRGDNDSSPMIKSNNYADKNNRFNEQRQQYQSFDEISRNNRFQPRHQNIVNQSIDLSNQNHNQILLNKSALNNKSQKLLKQDTKNMQNMSTMLNDVQVKLPQIANISTNNNARNNQNQTPILNNKYQNVSQSTNDILPQSKQRQQLLRQQNHLLMQKISQLQKDTEQMRKNRQQNLGSNNSSGINSLNISIVNQQNNPLNDITKQPYANHQAQKSPEKQNSLNSLIENGLLQKFQQYNIGLQRSSSKEELERQYQQNQRPHLNQQLQHQLDKSIESKYKLRQQLAQNDPPKFLGEQDSHQPSHRANTQDILSNHQNTRRPNQHLRRDQLELLLERDKSERDLSKSKLIQMKNKKSNEDLLKLNDERLQPFIPKTLEAISRKVKDQVIESVQTENKKRLKERFELPEFDKDEKVNVTIDDLSDDEVGQNQNQKRGRKRIMIEQMKDRIVFRKQDEYIKPIRKLKAFIRSIISFFDLLKRTRQLRLSKKDQKLQEFNKQLIICNDVTKNWIMKHSKIAITSILQKADENIDFMDSSITSEKEKSTRMMQIKIRIKSLIDGLTEGCYPKTFPQPLTLFINQQYNNEACLPTEYLSNFERLLLKIDQSSALYGQQKKNVDDWHSYIYKHSDQKDALQYS